MYHQVNAPANINAPANVNAPLTMGANVPPMPAMSYGYTAPVYAYGCHYHGGFNFAIIVVLFILLIIIGACGFCGPKC